LRFRHAVEAAGSLLAQRQERSIFMRLLSDALLSVLLAPACAACDRPLDNPTETTVCAPCWASIRPLTPPLCASCGDPLPSWRKNLDERCIRCRPGEAAITLARAIGEYAGALRAVIHAFKYGGRRSIASPLSALMRTHGHEVLTGADVVIPVPLHWRRHWKRGFNQAAELAAGLGIPTLHALRRARRTVSQTDLPAELRHANVRRAFRVKHGIQLTDLCVVLVDDVSTTGATLEACAKVLLNAHVREVRALTAARVVTRPPIARPS
jgi:ComF family protein